MLKGYYFKDGAFHVEKSWVKKLKVVCSVALFCASMTLTKELAIPEPLMHSVSSPYISYIRTLNPELQYKEARDIVLSTYRWAEKYDVDEKMLFAIQKVESSFKVHAISSSGAYGLMQVIPVWHKEKVLKARDEVGTPELFNISTNIYLGAWVYRDCLKRTGEVQKALMCYSGQTPGYDKKVMAAYSSIQKL